MRYITALAKMCRLMDGLEPHDRKAAAKELNRLYGGAWTAAERASRFRDAHRNEPVTPLRNEIVTDPRYAPPTPPVVSSLFSSSSPAVPVLASKTKTSLNGSFESSYPGFKTFWNQYPKRVGKGEAERAWKKNRCENDAKIINDALLQQLDFLLRDEGKFIPNPATWLNGKRWQDEPPMGRRESLSERLWREAQEEKR